MGCNSRIDPIGVGEIQGRAARLTNTCGYKCCLGPPLVSGESEDLHFYIGGAKIKNY